MNPIMKPMPIKRRSFKRRVSEVLFLFMAVELTTQFNEAQSWAAGKKAGVNSCVDDGSPSGPPLFSTPIPVRKVRLLQIGTKAFPLPNGAQVDLNFDLQSVLNTAVASSPVFSPLDLGGDGPCDSHLELRSAVTTFQLDLVEVGVSFGFSPAGAMGGITSMTGAAKVKVGAIAMDFSLWQCDGKNCWAVAASTSTHAVAGGGVTFDIDFGMITTGAGLVFHPALGATLRSIMADGVKQLAASPRVSELPWTARVRDYNPADGSLIFDAGVQARLSPNQTFEIYAPTDTTEQGVCDVFQTVAFVHTSAVYAVSSHAIVDQVLDPRGVQKGDLVMIRTLNKSTKIKQLR